MPIIGNKRVTQLVELTANEVAQDDLFYIIDVSARESKRIKTSVLSQWLNDSASITAFHSITADTASFVLGSNVFGPVASSSFALTTISAAWANNSNNSNNSISSSYSLTSSFALNGGGVSSNSASYLIYSGVPNGTASYALKSSISDTSTNAQFLIYTGGNNGTSSYAITTGNVIRADTASYFDNISGVIASASHADVSDYAVTAATSVTSNFSNFLIYSFADNGTASYAMVAKVIAGIKDYGIFLANTQSTFIAQLDDIDVLWSTTSTASTQIEAMGTVIVPFTSSIPTNGTVILSLIDRNTGIKTLLDSTPVSVNISPTIGTWGSYNSGTIKLPFSLMGQSHLYGSYMVFVSSSNNIQIEPSRTTRFSISSESDTFNAYSTELLQFVTTPISEVTFSFSTAGGIYGDGLVGLLVTGSSNILTLNAINQNITSVRYLWTLNNLTASNISNNPISYLSNIPNSLTYLSCSNCQLVTFYSFSSSLLSNLTCNNNLLISLPNFPVSMSYLDCSNNFLSSVNLPLTLSYLDCSDNFLTSLPNPLPSGLTTFFANSNYNLQSTSFTFPNTIISMSLDNNPSLAFSASSLPTSLVSFVMDNTSIAYLPSIPVGVSNLSMNNCNLTTTFMDNISADLSSSLLSSAIISGSLDIRANGAPSLNALIDLNALSINGWTLLYDP